MDQEEHPTEPLLAAAQRGDPAAREELFRRHIDALHRFVRSRAGRTLRQSESTWDLVQTACRQALPRLAEFEWRGEGSFRSWLFAFAISKIHNRIHHRRAAKRSTGREESSGAKPLDAIADADTSGTDPADHAIAREDVARLAVAMEQLPPQYRDIITRSRLLGLSHREIAADLGKSEGTVRVLLSRAMARLGSLLDQGDSSTDGPATDTT